MCQQEDEGVHSQRLSTVAGVVKCYSSYPYKHLGTDGCLSYTEEFTNSLEGTCSDSCQQLDSSELS